MKTLILFLAMILIGINSAMSKFDDSGILQDSSSKFIISEIQPSLKGATNKAIIESKVVNKKSYMVVKMKDEPGYNLILNVGNVFTPGLNANFTEKITKFGVEGMSFCCGGFYAGFFSSIQGTGNLEVYFENISNNGWFTGIIDFYNSEYIIMGKISLYNYIFESDNEYPLEFKLIKDLGFVYQNGKGTVTSPDGIKNNFPMNE